ncbi:MAG: hypothetical protein JRI68_10035 [Deltaproteobacteria bacterium]|nr:hypothetical protein [Deltaproteobacteria bacterium]
MAPDAIGSLILRRFCGEEEFVVSKAETLAVHDECGVALWFEAETGSDWER